jgi:peptidoglycan/xylan/chitin deacetylase (PgdA/CDA1 family)
VGIHSYSHIAQCTPERAIYNLDETAKMIEQATGKQPTVFRPPYGITTNELSKRARKEGYPVILWSMATGDTDRKVLREPDVLARNVIHPNPGGAFVLMHDGSGHMASVKALSLIIPQLQAQGWKFVTIPELLRAWDAWMQSQAAPAAPSAPVAGGGSHA